MQAEIGNLTATVQIMGHLSSFILSSLFTPASSIMNDLCKASNEMKALVKNRDLPRISDGFSEISIGSKGLNHPILNTKFMY